MVTNSPLRWSLFALCASVVGGGASTAACTSFGEKLGPDAGDTTPADDGGASSDAGAVGCDPATPFGPAVLVPGLATAEHLELSARFSPDEQVAYFARLSLPSGASYTSEVFTTRRTTTSTAFSGFGRMSVAPPLRALDSEPTVTADERTIFFARRDPTTDSATIMKASLTAQGLGFLQATKLAGPVNEGTSQAAPYVLPDGSALYFHRGSPYDPSRIYRASRTSSGAFAEVAAVEGLVSEPDRVALAPVVSPDELTIYWAAAASQAEPTDIYVATRTDRSSAFSKARAVGELNTVERHETPTFISGDGCRLYFSRLLLDPPYRADILVATKPR